MTEPLTSEQCRYCRRPKSEHEQTSEGLRCRTVQFFAPCEHKRRTGTGWAGSDGKGGSDMTCDDCGERFLW